MKHPNGVMSPLNWLILHLGYVPSFFVLFRPSGAEFLTLLVVDTIVTLPIMFVADRILFLRKYPAYRSVFPRPSETVLQNLRVEDQIQLIEQLLHFPARRAAYILTVNLVKILPGTLLIFFVWVSELTLLERVLRLVLICSLIYSFFYAAIYLDSKAWVTKFFGELHTKYSWESSFLQATHAKVRKKRIEPETWALLSIWIFLILIQSYLLFEQSHSISGFSFQFEVIWISVASLVCMSRIWVQFRSQQENGIRRIFTEFENFEPGKSNPELTVDSAPILFHFGKILYALAERLRVYERELTSWTFRTAEESRLQTLGEVSALVLHDLGHPLHALSFCLEEMKDEKDPVRLEKLRARAESASQSAQEFVATMKRSLRRSSEANAGEIADCELGAAWQDVRKLLDLRATELKLALTTLHWDESLNGLHIRAQRADLIHILFNLTANAVRASMKEDAPRVEWKLLSQGAQEVTFAISDNGPGLSPEEFARLTAFIYQSGTDSGKDQGLGLRLTARLIERLYGSLTLDPTRTGGRGATLVLRLPRGKTRALDS